MALGRVNVYPAKVLGLPDSKNPLPTPEPLPEPVYDPAETQAYLESLNPTMAINWQMSNKFFGSTGSRFGEAVNVSKKFTAEDGNEYFETENMVTEINGTKWQRGMLTSRGAREDLFENPDQLFYSEDVFKFDVIDKDANPTKYNVKFNWISVVLASSDSNQIFNSIEKIGGNYYSSIKFYEQLRSGFNSTLFKDGYLYYKVYAGTLDILAGNYVEIPISDVKKPIVIIGRYDSSQRSIKLEFIIDDQITTHEQETPNQSFTLGSKNYYSNTNTDTANLNPYVNTFLITHNDIETDNVQALYKKAGIWDKEILDNDFDEHMNDDSLIALLTVDRPNYLVGNNTSTFNTELPVKTVNGNKYFDPIINENEIVTGNYNRVTYMYNGIRHMFDASLDQAPDISIAYRIKIPPQGSGSSLYPVMLELADAYYYVHKPIVQVAGRTQFSRGSLTGSDADTLQAQYGKDVLLCFAQDGVQKTATIYAFFDDQMLTFVLPKYYNTLLSSQYGVLRKSLDLRMYQGTASNDEHPLISHFAIFNETKSLAWFQELHQKGMDTGIMPKIDRTLFTVTEKLLNPDGSTQSYTGTYTQPVTVTGMNGTMDAIRIDRNNNVQIDTDSSQPNNSRLEITINTQKFIVPRSQIEKTFFTTLPNAGLFNIMKDNFQQTLDIDIQFFQ